MLVMNCSGNVPMPRPCCCHTWVKLQLPCLMEIPFLVEGCSRWQIPEPGGKEHKSIRSFKLLAGRFSYKPDATLCPPSLVSVWMYGCIEAWKKSMLFEWCSIGIG